MDIYVEDVRLYTQPCHHQLGLFATITWLVSFTWPVHLYQTIICFALGTVLENYLSPECFAAMRARLINVNEWLVPLPFFGSVILSIEQGLCLLVVWVWVRRRFLQCNLSYTRWIYYPDASHDNTLWRKLWRFGLWFCWGSCPSTFDADKILPSLPLPAVHATVKRVLGSLAPYLGVKSRQYEEIKDGLEKWSMDHASGSQRRLKAKKWISGNHVTAWWESFHFLTHHTSRGHDTLYGAFQNYFMEFTTNPLARAAVLLYVYGNMRTLTQSGFLRPEMFEGRVPMCMQQWHRLFATTRVPGEEHDDLWTYPPSVSKHIVVVHAGHYYWIPLFTKRRRIVSPDVIQNMLQFVVEDSHKRSGVESEPPYSPALLTAMARDEWYKARNDFFTFGENSKSLDVVEKALCFVYLNTDTAYSLEGCWGKIWSDKSVNFVVFKDSRIKMYVDRSAVEPSIICSFLERLRVAEERFLYDHETGNALPIEGAEIECEEPVALKWQQFEEMRQLYRRAHSHCLLERSKARVSLLHINQFGRSCIKQQWGLPADAFMQAAIHAAFYRLKRTPALCAETVPTRLFTSGRSDILRSLTTEMSEFIISFSNLKFSEQACDSSSSGKEEECIRLLRIACDRHRCLLRHTMTGKGVDCHILTLYLATQFRTMMACDALRKVIDIPFDIVSCRLPNATAKGSWLLHLPLPLHENSLAITYACQSDPEGLQFCVAGRGQVDVFVEALNETMLDLHKLLR